MLIGASALNRTNTVNQICLLASCCKSVWSFVCVFSSSCFSYCMALFASCLAIYFCRLMVDIKSAVELGVHVCMHVFTVMCNTVVALYNDCMSKEQRVTFEIPVLCGIVLCTNECKILNMWNSLLLKSQHFRYNKSTVYK